MKDVKLINQNFLEKKLKESKEQVQDNSQIFLKWHNDNRKEEAIQSDFLNDIFGKILGYEIETDKEYNLDKEYKTQKDGTKVDGVLGFFTKESKNVKAVVELKGKNTKNLDEVEKQAFEYRDKIDGIEFVITSNTEEIRLYSAKSGGRLKYQSWTMLELSNSIQKQKEFYFLLSKQNLIGIDKQATSNTKKLIEEDIKREDEIKAKFYKEYKALREDFVKDILKQNQVSNDDSISKTQKLLDRLLFIRFCEDNNFITKPFEKVDFAKQLGFPLWDSMKQLFIAIDKGNPPHIHKFNGGLFATDELFDGLKISTNLLEKLIGFLRLYHFKNDISVHILGHIFEQSITDLEALKAGLSEENFDKKQGKRKKDGIFYTPEYITKYIVEEAVGGWLKDRKNELEIDKHAPQEVPQTKPKKWVNPNAELINKYKQYAEKLKQIKVLDPACGSGAFLVEVFHYLENEWLTLSETLRKLGDIDESGLFNYKTIYKSILQNNIYGVDLNNESVQITKLSLWLKTANLNDELTTLDNNIKCGNSLIDDPEIAGEKAFKWEEEFPFKFDVVVGNPPYVGQKGNSELFIPFQKLYPEFYDRKQDLYYYFIYKGLSLLSQNGYIAFIIPPYFLTATSAINLRKEILKNEIKSLLEIKASVFDSASIHSLIFLFKKHKANENNFNVYQLEKEKKLVNSYNQNELTQDNWYILGSGKSIDVKVECKTLGEIARISPGIQTGFDKAYIIQKEELSKFNEEERKFIKKFYKNSHIQRYNIQDSEEYIIITNEINEIKQYPNIEKHLLNFKNELDKRFRNFTLKNADKEEKWWFMYGYRPNTNFEGEKILIPYRSSQNNFVVSRGEFYASVDVFYIDIFDTDFSLEYLSCVLSSKFIYHYLLKNCKKKGDVFEFYQEPLKTIPIAKIPLVEQQPFITHAQTMLDLTKQLNEIVNSFYDYLLAKLGNPTKDLGKIKNWHKFDNSSFLELINKIAKMQKISIDDEALLNKFKEKISITNDLQGKISQTDNEIDKMVYSLYGLSEEEIGVVNKA